MEAALASILACRGSYRRSAVATADLTNQLRPLNPGPTPSGHQLHLLEVGPSHRAGRGGTGAIRS